MSIRLARSLVGSSLALVLAAPVLLLPVSEAVAQDGRRGEARGGQPQPDGGGRAGRGGMMDRQGGQPGRGRGGGGGMFGGAGGGMFGGAMRSAWERRDLVILDRELDLDADQEMIIEVLMADYLDGFRAEGERIRDEMQDARPGGQIDDETRERFREMRRDIGQMRERMREAGDDAEVRERISAELQARIDAIREEARAMRPSQEERAESTMEIAGLLSEWDRIRRQLDAAFKAEMSLILSQGQLEKLPEVEIDIRRARLLPSGRLSGESIDLTILARQAGIEQQVDPVLETLWPEYERQLDTALIARDEHVSTMGVTMMDAFRTQDPSLAIEASRTEGRLREAVRDINLRYQEMATALLGESGVDTEVIGTFDGRFREAAFNRIYGPTFAQRSIAAAASLEDISPDVQGMIAGIEAAYAAEIAGLNQLMEIETIQSDAARITDRIERFAARMQGEDRGDETRPDARLRELFEQRQTVDDRFRQQLESLLTPEQVAQLPETRQARAERRQAEQAQRRQDMMERFDRDGDGELSREERRAIGEAMRQERGGRGGRGERGGDGEG